MEERRAVMFAELEAQKVTMIAEADALVAEAEKRREALLAELEAQKVTMIAEADAKVAEAVKRGEALLAEVEERRAAMMAELDTQVAEENRQKKRREALLAEVEERRAAMIAELDEEKKRKEGLKRGLAEPITFEEMVSEGPPAKRVKKVGLILDMLKNVEPFTADEARPALSARVRWLMRLD